MRCLFLVMAFFFVGCSSPKVIASKPSWYFQQVADKNEIIGYGEGDSCEEAKNRAREDIAKQLVVNVESEMEVSQDSEGHYYSKSLVRESVDKMTLNGVQLAHQPEQIESTCYVAMRYSLDPLLFKASLAAKNAQVEEMDHNALLAHSIFAKQLSSSIGYIPRFSLVFHGKQVFLRIGHESILLSKQEMRMMVFEKQSKLLRLSVNPSSYLRVDDRYIINLDVQQANYLSLIYIDEDYNARVAIKNQYISQQEKMEYPKNQALLAGIASKDSHIKEMYVALLCEEPLNLSPFSVLDENTYVNKDALKLSELFVLAEQCESTSIILSIQQR